MNVDQSDAAWEFASKALGQPVEVLKMYYFEPPVKLFRKLQIDDVDRHAARPPWSWSVPYRARPKVKR